MAAMPAPDSPPTPPSDATTSTDSPDRPIGPWPIDSVANAAAAVYGRPLDGVRILAIEQMQALPFATQLLGRLGAEVVKVEHPVGGESGRGALPAMTDPDGNRAGATFLRNNLGKRSIGVDLKSDAGRDLVLRLAPRFDVVAENFKPGTMDRLGLGYADVAAVHPGAIYLSVSGFGNPVWDGLERSPYASWPAYASVAEAMSGLYEFKRQPGHPPVASPAGALGDISTALFGVIGVLAALRHREATGLGQHVDVAMLDSTIAMTDLITNFWSLGQHEKGAGPVLMDGFQAGDGWFTMQVGREHQFAKLAELVGHPEWLDDPDVADRTRWTAQTEPIFRPAIEAWASSMSKVEACQALSAVGIPAGPCFDSPEVIADPHVSSRRMLVAMERTDGVAEPVLIPGNPVKLSRVAEGPETRVPWVGEHTDDVLAAELGLGAEELGKLRADGAIG
jgi:crotonobetainyl-CoA:carnitine CoA-transferase CaiB-like acyl-CoA transferase